MTGKIRYLFSALAIAGSALFGSAAPAGSETRWFHLTVDEAGPDGDRVRINLPIKVVEAALPLIESDGLSSGHIRINGRELREADLRRLLEATRDAEDGEYVQVEGREERVLVSKRGSELLLEASEFGEESEEVTIQVPFVVLDALLSGPPETLNLEAALRVLNDQKPGEFITIRDEDSTVRIWIDERKTGN